jgi:hypothetical protein
MARTRFGESLEEAIRIAREVQSRGGIRRYILLVIVSSVLGLWYGILNAIEGALAIIANIPVVFYATARQIGAPAWRIVDYLNAVSASVEAFAAGLGFAGPVASALGFAVPVMVLAVLANFALGLLGTYLPMESIPLVRRWFT